MCCKEEEKCTSMFILNLISGTNLSRTSQNLSIEGLRISDILESNCGNWEEKKRILYVCVCVNAVKNIYQYIWNFIYRRENIQEMKCFNLSHQSITWRPFNWWSGIITFELPKCNLHGSTFQFQNNYSMHLHINRLMNRTSLTCDALRILYWITYATK